MKTSTLQIDGKTLALAYDFNAIADAEGPAGCNLLAALENLSDLSAQQLRGLLYAAIVVELPEVKPTVVDCGNMVRLDTIAPITMALAKAYEIATPGARLVVVPPAAVAPVLAAAAPEPSEVAV